MRPQLEPGLAGRCVGGPHPPPVMYQMSCIADIHLVIRNNSKISSEVATKVMLWLGGSPKLRRNCVKGWKH